jgi:hypothetical protein
MSFSGSLSHLVHYVTELQAYQRTSHVAHITAKTLIFSAAGIIVPWFDVTDFKISINNPES